MEIDKNDAFIPEVVDNMSEVLEINVPQVGDSMIEGKMRVLTLTRLLVTPAPVPGLCERC